MVRRRAADRSRQSCVVAAFALWSFADSLGPLDLSAAEKRSTVVLDRDGRLLRPFATADGRWRLPVAAADVDPRFLAMLKAYEDRRFDRHPGIDPMALLRAAGQLLAHGRVVSGGSTLTMQVARLLEPREERTLAREGAPDRARGAARAAAVEGRRSSPSTSRSRPMAATSRARARRRSPISAASRSACPSPRRRSSSRCRRRRRRAGPTASPPTRGAPATGCSTGPSPRGLLNAAEARAAKAEAVPAARRPFPMLAAHATEAAVAERPDAKVHRLAIDGRLQASLETLVRERLEPMNAQLSAAILVIDNDTGEVRAHVGSAGYLARDRAGAVDMTAALRSPGSALKPFIYALAFENGVAHPETLVDDRPSRFGAYAPENFDLSYQGTVTARRALQLSLNVPAVELLAEVGPARFIARLRQGGATIALPKEAPAGLAVGLGGLGITLADLTRLYAGLARGGDAPGLVRRLDGAAPVPDRRVTEPVAAWYVADILKGAPPPENALAGRIAFKTGTSYGFRDAWAVGFDRDTTIGVWVGRPDGAAVPGLVGRLVAAPMLFDAYARLGREPAPVPMPSHALVASTAALPPPLRHLRKDVPKTVASTTSAPLKIAYPLDGSRVELGFARAGEAAPLALKAAGGVPPLTWLVNGAPVTAPMLRRQSTWSPDGAGFARVSVMDAKGATDSVVVRIE